MTIEQVILNAMVNGVKVTLTPNTNGTMTNVSFIKEFVSNKGKPVKAAYRPKLQTKNLSITLAECYDTFTAYCAKQSL